MPDDKKPVQKAQRATRKPPEPVIYVMTYSEQSKVLALLQLFFQANATQDSKAMRKLYQDIEDILLVAQGY